MKNFGFALLRTGKNYTKFFRGDILLNTNKHPLIWRQRLYFSQDESKKISLEGDKREIPQQNLQITPEQVKIGEEVVNAYKTKGAISILDKLKGTKQTQTGELYALMFTCKKCNTRSLRSFTKNAYHNGVVLIRCEGCQNVHLIADNLGWFEDEPKNIEHLNSGQVKKVHDPIAIVQFLKAALGEKTENKEQDESLKAKQK